MQRIVHDHCDLRVELKHINSIFSSTHFVIRVLVNHIGDRIGVRQVSHPSSGWSPGVATTVGT